MEKEEHTCEGQPGFRPTVQSLRRPYTLGDITQSRKDARANNVVYISKCSEAVRHSEEKWVAELIVENRDQRRGTKNDRKGDGMYEKCRDTGRGNTEVCGRFTRSCTGMYAITHSQGIFNVLIGAVEAVKQEVTVGKIRCRD